MRRTILSLVLVMSASLSLGSAALAASADAEAAFIKAYQSAFDSKNADALSALLAPGGDPTAVQFYTQMMTSELQDGKLSSIALKDLTPEDVANAAQIQPGPNGNLQLLPKPYKKLVLHIDTKTADTTASSDSEIFVADVNGKVLISVPTPAK
jgi:hypothetical protein